MPILRPADDRFNLSPHDVRSRVSPGTDGRFVRRPRTRTASKGVRMSPEATTQPFTGSQDRRNTAAGESPIVERRQFADSHADLSPEARELAAAIDDYKRMHRRRFITHEEMVAVIRSLGYHK